MKGLVLRTKVLMANLLANGVTGRWVGSLCADRVPSRGIVVDTSHPAITAKTKALLFWGLYESSEVRALDRIRDWALPVVELGASIGYVTSQIAKRRKNPLQVAVEADPDLVPLIRRNLAANGLGSVSIVSGAVDYSGAQSATFFRGAENTSGSVASHARTNGASSVGNASAEVPVLTLGMVLDRFGIREYILVSDIEGAEAGMILRESPEVIRRCRFLVAELHGCLFEGSRYSAEDLAGLIRERWGMKIVAGDGKVWSFERAAAD